MRVLACLAASYLCLSAGAASAQAVCQVEGVSTCGPGQAASLVSVSGEVSMLRVALASPATSGSALSVGDRLLTRNGAATMSVGGCSVSLPARSSAVLFTRGGQMCVSIVGVAGSWQAQAPALAAPSLAAPSLATAAVGSLAAAGVTAIAVTQLRGSRANPLSP